MSESWAVRVPTKMDVPPGFGFIFTPSNEELIKDYLQPKITGTAAPAHDVDVDLIIPTVDDVCKWDPSDIQSLCSKPWDYKMFCYFFCKWVPYGKGGNQCCRKTRTGSWNKTGKELDIVDSETDTVIGKRSIFRFRRGHGRTRAKTAYIIHEYKIMDHSPCHQVICRLEKPATTETKETEKNRVEVPQSLGNGGTCAVSPEASSLDSELNDGREPVVGDVACDGAIPSPPQVVDEEARFDIESIASENGLKEWIARSLSQSLGSPFNDGGESSVNITSYGDILSAIATETQPFFQVDNEAMSSIQSLSREPLFSPPHSHGQMQALCGSAGSDPPSSDLLDMFDIFYDPDDGSEQNMDSIFNGLYEPASTDVPESRNTDGGGGVNGLAESRSLAPGPHLP